MSFKRIVDLSYPIIPGETGRKFDIEQIDADAVAPVPRLPGQWYIMHNVCMVNHLGTHIEVPFHLRKDGQDLEEFPVEKTIGTTRLLDVGHPPPGHALTLEEIKQATYRAGGVEPGELVFVRTGWDKFWGGDEYLKSPWVKPEALEWLVRQGMVLFGIEAAGVEELTNPMHDSHYALFDHNVALIENLRNLAALGNRNTFVSVCTPICIHGLEAFPVRVLGILNYAQI